MSTGLIGLKNHRLTSLWRDLVGRAFQRFSLRFIVDCGGSGSTLIKAKNKKARKYTNTPHPKKNKPNPPFFGCFLKAGDF